MPPKKSAKKRAPAKRPPPPPPPPVDAAATSTDRSAPSTDVAKASTAQRSEGHRLLAARPESGPTIAAAVGVSRQVVAQWRSGRKVPSGPARDRLAERFEIPAASWDTNGPSGPAPTAAGAPSTEAPAIERDDGLEESIRECRRNATDSTLRAEVRVRYVAELNKLLITRAKMKDDARQAERVREQKLTRHPRAARMFTTLFDAIAEWPDALRAQQLALERLRAEEDAT